MIVSQVSSVYDIVLPAAITVFLERVSQVLTLGLDQFATPLACLGLGRYPDTLAFWMLVPPAILVLMIVGAVLVMCYQQQPITFEKLSLKIAPLGIKFLFVLYPVITNACPSRIKLLVMGCLSPLFASLKLSLTARSHC